MFTLDKLNNQLTSAPNKEQQFIEKAKALINQTEATDVSQLLSEVISANLSQEAAKKLLEAIPKNYYEGGTIKDGVPQGIKDLINFLEPIAGPFPKYENMELDNNDGNESKSEGINDEEIGKLKSKVTSIVGEIQVINNNEKLGEISVILDNIGKILEKSNEANVKQLQTLIWNILAQGDNLDLGENSYNKDVFCNGTLEESTLDGLKQVLDRVEKYVRDVREQMDVINRQSEVKRALDVGSQTPAQSQDSENVTGSSESQQSKPELPGGYAILHQSITAFEASGLSLYSTEPSRKSVESDTQGSVDVVVGSTQNTAPEGDLHNKRVQEAVGKLNEMNDNNNAKENIYLMPIGSEAYAVRLDNQGCLYPIAVNVNSGKEILLKNNPSCIQYLKNRLSEKLSSSNDVKIMWNGEDYVIGKSRYEKWLTIEPMTIAGKWASKDLGRCLAFLNFTNYLRNEGSMHNVEFKNDNPDLRLGDNGNMEVRVKKKLFGKGRLGFSNTEFGLGNNPEDLKKFIKYNNGEHWEDDWDKKEENRLYGGIDISQEIQSNKGAQTQNENGGNNPTAQPSGIPDGGGNRYAAETQQDAPLIAVDNGFNRGNYGINPSENVSVLKSGEKGKETYYYQYNEQIVRIAYPYYVAESASGIIGAGNTLPQGLSFTPKLNVCVQGAEGLTAKLGGLLKNIRKDGEFGGEVVVDGGNYILQWPKDGDKKNNIMIGGKDFLSEHKIVNEKEGENCLKVLLYAYENYDKIQSEPSYTLPDDGLKDYGITDNNRKQVQERLDSLRSSSDK